MRNNLKSWRIAVAMIGIIVGLAIVPMPRAWAGNNPRVIPRVAHSFGNSYAQWSAEWWKWQLRLPATNHPAFSLDGANCSAGQSGKVWFLTGAFTSEVPENEFATIVRESCSVPVGKAIFFPIINVECSTIDTDPGFHRDNPDELLDCAKSWVEDPNAVVKDLLVEIDGRTLKNLDTYRFQSPVFNFSFEDTTDNILGVDCSVVNCSSPQAVSDGYWIMLPPLSKGEHTIRFTGSFRDPQTDGLFFGLDVTYELSVVGRR